MKVKAYLNVTYTIELEDDFVETEEEFDERVDEFRSKAMNDWNYYLDNGIYEEGVLEDVEIFCE